MNESTEFRAVLPATLIIQIESTIYTWAENLENKILHNRRDGKITMSEMIADLIQIEAQRNEALTKLGSFLKN